MMDDASDEIDPSNIAEEIDNMRVQKINISRAHYGDLLQIPFFSPMLAEELLLYRDTVVIVSTEQLRSLSLITPELYLKILPFITAGPEEIRGILYDDLFKTITMRSRLERRLPKQKGYYTGKYLGDRNSVLHRLRVSGNVTDVGALFEKDAGEQYSEGFISGFIGINDAGPFRRTIMGNFSVSSHQGLIFAKNIASTKGANAVGQIKRRSNGIAPGLSTDEYRYFQGLASQCVWERLSVTGFISRRQIHANIDESGTVSSLFTTGQFRTLNDLERKNTLREVGVGGIVEYSTENSATISFNAVHLSYNKELRPSLFDFEGRKGITAAGIGIQATLVKGEIFSELASNDGRRFSTVLGTIVPFSRRFAFGFHHRSFTKGYVNPLARPFGERTNIADGETGNYFGMQIRMERVAIDWYADLFTLPSTTSLFGSSGREVFTRITIPISKQFQVLALLRTKTRNQVAPANIDDERSQSNVRFEYQYTVDRHLQVTQRLEYVSVQYQPSTYRQHGFLTFCDALYRSQSTSWQFKTRVVFFDTDSYDSRLYQYESDVSGNMSNPPLYGSGIRWYVVSVYNMLNGLKISFKYSETKKLHTVIMGSGDDEINGNNDNAIAVQLDFRL
jgi:hypothetical protein